MTAFSPNFPRIARRTIPPVETPWGPSQSKEIYGDGVIFYETASHGGYQLDEKRNGLVAAPWRLDHGWYEEDTAWAIIAYTFPDLFTPQERAQATSTLVACYPDQYEAVSGSKIAPGASAMREQKLFDARHIDDFVVVSAIFSAQNPGHVEAIARRARDGKERRVLVPADEYGARSSHGFVLRPVHRNYDGPSSFIGLRSN